MFWKYSNMCPCWMSPRDGRRAHHTLLAVTRRLFLLIPVPKALGKWAGGFMVASEVTAWLRPPIPPPDFPGEGFFSCASTFMTYRAVMSEWSAGQRTAPPPFKMLTTRMISREITEVFSLSFCRKNHSKCLVHCKMGVSRSASTVIAYAMKEFGWSLEKAYNYVKQKRSIARPNAGFMRQLLEYEGILDAR